MNLSEKAMVVRLTMHKWGARKKEKDVARAVSIQYEAEDGSVITTKHLVDKDVLKAIDRPYGKLYWYHIENTLPWDDAGGRILPAANYFQYNEKARALIAACDAAVDILLDRFEEAKANAKRSLGKLYRESDYPTRHELKRKYGVNITVMPLPAVEDFRVDLGDVEVTNIKKQLAENLSEKYDEAMMDLYERVRDVVGKFADTMNDPEKIFRDSKVNNIASLVEILPRLNLTGNGKLEKIRKEIEAKLLGYDTEQLRNEPDKRAEAAKAADEILKKMSGYVGK